MQELLGAVYGDAYSAYPSLTSLDILIVFFLAEKDRESC